MQIVFLILTPLAGAPIRIANALNKYTDNNVRVINLNPTWYGNRTYQEDLDFRNNKEKCLELISQADILHFHHFFDIESENNPFNINFKKITPHAKCIRHFHSNLDFLSTVGGIDRNTILNDKYAKLVVPHCAERTYLDAFVVPNIIPINDEIMLPKKTKNKIPKVFYSASSTTSMWDARWEAKGYPEITAKFKKINEEHKFDFQIITNTPYEKCQLLKQDSDIILGDITSGSYHLTDLEALSMGKPTFSYLDPRTQLTLTTMLKCSDLPFINTRFEEIDLPFIEILNNVELRKEIGKFSRYWIEKYYKEEKLVKFYQKAYEKVLNNEPLHRQNYLKFNKSKIFLYNKLYDLQYKQRKINAKCDKLGEN